MRSEANELDLSAPWDELDRMLNDPDVRMEPGRIWALADEVAARVGRESVREQA